MMDGNADVTDLMGMLERTRLAQYGTAALSNPTMDSIDVFFDGINSFGGFSNYAYDQGRQSQAMLDLGLHKARSADEVESHIGCAGSQIFQSLFWTAVMVTSECIRAAPAFQKISFWRSGLVF